jgi:hypothetical protein
LEKQNFTAMVEPDSWGKSQGMQGRTLGPNRLRYGRVGGFDSALTSVILSVLGGSCIIAAAGSLDYDRESVAALNRICNARQAIPLSNRSIWTESYAMRSINRAHVLKTLCSQQREWSRGSVPADPAMEVDKFIVFKTARSGSEWLVGKWSV